MRKSAVSDPLEAAAPTAALSPPAEARAARLVKFAREQHIVEYLNRGVSVVEIAARVGVGEKRTRAIIRDIFARRMPHPPREFVAIQLSRLNEALLVAYSAMSPTNLEAVDQVVKIVRELDRYGGAFAAEWARPEASRAEPGERPLVFGGALFCSAELGLQDHQAASAEPGRDDRPENPAQELEKIKSAPGVSPPVAALPRVRARGSATRSTTALTSPSAPTVARKIRRKVLKRLNPRPRSRPMSPRPPRVRAQGSATRSTTALTSPPAPAIARIIRRKVLKRLNPRPGSDRAVRPPRPLRPTRSQLPISS